MLIGRAREIDLVRAAADRAVAGTGSVFALVGAPGIGKTRLADEIAAQAPTLGLDVHWGRGWETGGAPAYWPWAEVIDSIARTGEPIPPALAAISRASGAMGEARRADPAEGRFALFDATATFLRDVASRRPLLLVFDDAHAADVPTLELIHFVARNVRAGRLLLVLTWRDAEGRQHPVAEAIARIAREATVLRLAPLDGSQVAQVLLSSPVPEAADPALAASLHARTQGNPLFLHEALRLVASGTPLSELHGTAGVDAVIRQRVGRLSAEVAELLPAAAVLGRELPADLLALVSGLEPPEVERRARGLVAAGLVTRMDGGWLFEHVLVREALYDGLGDERRALHARAARAIEARGDPAQVALCLHHALAALPEVDPAWAVRVALAAAERARTQGAWEDAVTLLERTRAATGTQIEPGHRCEMSLALGWAALDAGRSAAAREAFGEATRQARQVGDARLLARAALGFGAEYVYGTVRVDLAELLEEALAALGPDDTLLRARLLARLGAAYVPGPRTPEALGMAREALRAIEGRADDRIQLEVTVAAGSALAELADPNEGMAVTEAMVRLARRTGDRVLELRGLGRRVIEHLALGEVAAADAVLAMRDELAKALRLPRFQWQAPLFASMRAMIQGRFDVCDAAYEEASALAARADDANSRRCLAIHRMWVLLLADRAADLVAHEPSVQRALDTMTNADVFARGVTGIVVARRGEAEAARRILAPLALESFRVTGYMLSISVADALVEVGDRSAASRLIVQIESAADYNAVWGLFGITCGQPVSATLARLHAVQGARDEAERLFGAALDRTIAMDAPALEAWVRYGWGADLGRSDMLAEAEAIAGRLGMDGLVQRIRVRQQAVTPLPGPAPIAFTLRRASDGFSVERDGRAIRLRSLKGLEMLERLVGQPGRPLQATDLARGGVAPEADDRGDAGEMLDAKARLAYKTRLLALREELNEAQAYGHVDRAQRIHDEMQALARELSRAVGLGGRPRRAGAADERARVSVAHRIREAIRRIAEHDPDLGRHLDWAVRTGSTCVYDPNRGAR